MKRRRYRTDPRTAERVLRQPVTAARAAMRRRKATSSLPAKRLPAKLLGRNRPHPDRSKRTKPSLGDRRRATRRRRVGGRSL